MNSILSLWMQKKSFVKWIGYTSKKLKLWHGFPACL